MSPLGGGGESRPEGCIDPRPAPPPVEHPLTRACGPPQVLLELTDNGAWIVPKLRGSESTIQASMAATGFPHPVIEVIPRIATSDSRSTQPTACPCGPQSLAVRQPDSQTTFGPRDGASADAAALSPVHVRVRVGAAVLTRARRLVADMNLTQSDCCPFDTLVDVQWRLQGPDGGHLLDDLLRAGQAKVVEGWRLVVAPSALEGHAAPYTVGVVARHAGTAEVLGMGLQAFTVADPPPRGALTVVPASGMRWAGGDVR